MTEDEWEGWNEPRRMLHFLKGKVTQRKLRLYKAGNCRLAWSLLTDRRSRAAVEVAERYADGTAGSGELDAARVAAYEAYQNVRIPLDRASPHVWAASMAIAVVAAPDMSAVGGGVSVRLPSGLSAEESPALLRDIFGNPFRPVTCDPAWLSWNGGVVRILAQSAYDDRELPSGHLATTRLALLADALEDAGCADAGMLEHLRSAGPHVRGCWVVDLLLGKE